MYLCPKEIFLLGMPKLNWLFGKDYTNINDRAGR